MGWWRTSNPLANKRFGQITPNFRRLCKTPRCSTYDTLFNYHPMSFLGHTSAPHCITNGQIISLPRGQPSEAVLCQTKVHLASRPGKTNAMMHAFVFCDHFFCDHFVGVINQKVRPNIWVINLTSEITGCAELFKFCGIHCVWWRMIRLSFFREALA